MVYTFKEDILHICFATTNRGLENLLQSELETLGATKCQLVNAGIQFQADLNCIMRINLHSRFASRIMLQVAFGGYRNEDDIYKIGLKVNWNHWFHVGNSIKVATTAINSPLKSLEFITLKIKDSVCDYFSQTVDTRPNVDKQDPDVRIYNFLTKDTITIYLDTSGEALFKRGYRQHHLEAPLKENLAAGIIKLSNWQPDAPFYDPMCGSGTIILEAISMGFNIAPGLKRSFAFEKLTPFDPEIFHQLKEQARKEINLNINLKIYAGDINKRALTILQNNLDLAEFTPYVKVKSGDFLNQNAPEKTGTLISNPPYGIRLEEQEQLAQFYPLLGNHLKQHYSNWNCWLLSADMSLPKLIRLKPNRKIPLFNGALDCRLYEFKMVQGSNR